MQTALGSLRSAGPSKGVKTDEGSTFWGIGAEGLTFTGNYRFRIVKGTISICGITLAAQQLQPWYDVSAAVAPYPTFKSAHLQSNSSNSEIELPNGLEKFPSIIEVTVCEGFMPNLRDLAPPFKSLWHPLIKLDQEDLNPALCFDIPASWRNVEIGYQKRFVTLGPKNSGKSSLSRFLVNKHIESMPNSQVYYLELDPGQPEYTPAGNLSLHLIDKLNFSPSYAHATFQGVVRSCHLGYTSPIETPHRYLDMCSFLVRWFESHSNPQDILIVNTPGWTKGLGFELNTAIVGLVGYDKAHIIHMGESEFDMVVTEVEKGGSNGSIGASSSAGSANPSDSKSTMTAGGFSSAELRNLQITSYLHHNDTSPITSWAPYDVPLGSHDGVWSTGVLDSAGISIPEDLAICLEGTLVSINLLPKEIESTAICLSENEANDIWQASTSVGFGVVQAITAQKIRLLTPLDVSSIDFNQFVVIVLRGRIQLPSWEVLGRSSKRGTPWVAVDKPVGIGGSYTKFRRNIQRN